MSSETRRSPRVASDGELLVPQVNQANHFNSIRLAMAALVIWSHCFAIFYGTEDFEPISLLLNGHYNAGNVAVRVFFIVSGFLIAQSFERSSSAYSYMKKRVARIYPGYLVATGICAFVIAPAFASTIDLSANQVLKTLGLNLLLQGHMPPSDAFSTHPVHAINGALWSIPFEFWCYIGVVAVGIVGVLRCRLLILLSALAMMAVKGWLDLHGLKPGGGIVGLIVGWPYLWFSIGPCFLMGVLVYQYQKILRRSATLLLSLIAALLVAAHSSKIACDFLFPIATAYATFFIAFSRSKIPDAARYGDFSYGTYLYGFPIQQMLLAMGLPFVVYVPVSLALGLVAGVLSWHVVEKHFTAQRAKSQLDGIPHEPGKVADRAQ